MRRIALAFLLIFFSSATTPKQEKWLISSVDHPASEALKPLVEMIYQQLGYDVEFVEMPITRRLIELNSGKFDADLASYEHVSDQYPDLIRIDPALVTLTLYLVCPAGQLCDTSTLEQSESVIHMDKRSAKILRDAFNLKTPTIATYIELPRTLIQLFTHERIHYFLHIVANGMYEYDIEREHQRFPLGEVKMYHHIHRKHQAFADSLGKAFSDHMRSLDSDI